MRFHGWRAPIRLSACPAKSLSVAVTGWGFVRWYLGDLDGAFVLASETCALDIIGARHVRDIEPGELVVITDQGIESIFPFANDAQEPPRFCIFEHVYFARPDSRVQGKSVYDVRKRIGHELAQGVPG